MPPFAPPDQLPARPAVVTLPAGSLLWRVHHESVPAEQFARPSHVFGGGRFDGSAATGYRYLYASAKPDTAIAEELLPEFDSCSGAERILLRGRITGRRLAGLRTQRDLTLLRLVSAQELASVGQDDWLVTARDGAYPQTREWARWLREQVPSAQGFLWTSMVDLPNTTLVLFEDRCGGVPVVADAGLARQLDGPRGAADWLVDMVSPYGIRTRPRVAPRPRVFLNYRSGNGDGAALSLHRELVQRLGEAAVFRDVNSIPPGGHYPDHLLANARRCPVMLSMVGRNWENCRDSAGRLFLADEQDWTRREILEAWGHERTVVPVLVGARARLRGGDLPPALVPLAFAEDMHLASGYGDAEVRLLVDKLLDRFPELTDPDYFPEPTDQE